MQTDNFGEAVANKFRLTRAPTLFAHSSAMSPIAFSRLHNDGAFRGRTMKVAPEDAFAFQVALAPMSSGDIWISGRHAKLVAEAPGDTFLFDLNTDPIANLRPPFDFLRFYLSTATMEELAYSRGLRRIGGLRSRNIGVQDPIMLALAHSILPLLRDPSGATALFLDSIALAFHAHVIHAYGSISLNEKAVGSSLAPWQLRRACAFMEAHLDGDPSIGELANECRLSASHFARAFRQTCGVPPHRWLMARRIERAKEMLLKSDARLAEIATACGFVDQSHLSRVFTQVEGQPPGRWRWLRRN